MLRQALGLRPKHTSGEAFALKDISFEVHRGETVALIGRNGSGKSTLLELITGTLIPTEGHIEVKGRISALLELGSGFHPENSGRENVILNGLLLGLSREDMLRRFDEIVAFADIGDVLDRPVKTYSSGMVMRLAFAVQVLCDPDILIIDEALSVGDFFFQQKCFSYIRSLIAKGVTLFFVSHDMGTVRDLCQRALYLKQGQLLFDGKSSEAIQLYLTEQNGPTLSPVTAPLEQPSQEPTEGEKPLLQDALWVNQSQAPKTHGKILAVAFYDARGEAATVFRMGETLKITVAYASHVEDPCHIFLTLLNKFNEKVTVTGSYFTQTPFPAAQPLSGGVAILVFELEIKLLLEAGQYALLVHTGTITEPNRGNGLNEEAVPPLGPLTISWDYENEPAHFLGPMGLPTEACYRSGSLHKVR